MHFLPKAKCTPELPLLIWGLKGGRVRRSCREQDATHRGVTSRAEGRACYSILVDQHLSPCAMGPSISLLGAPQSPKPEPQSGLLLLSQACSLLVSTWSLASTMPARVTHWSRRSR